MCFTVSVLNSKNVQNTMPETTKVYKVVKWTGEKLAGIYYGNFEYKPGELISSATRKRMPKTNTVVAEGIHVFLKRKDAQNEKISWCSRDCVVLELTARKSDFLGCDVYDALAAFWRVELTEKAYNAAIKPFQKKAKKPKSKKAKKPKSKKAKKPKSKKAKKPKSKQKNSRLQQPV